MTEQDSALEQAISWQLRLEDADEGIWADFVAWLEADELHASSFDRVAKADRLACEAMASGQIADAGPGDRHPIANDNVAPLRARRWWLPAGMVAAAVAASVIIPAALRTDGTIIYETPIGVARSVRLADGSSIELSGGTRLQVGGASARAVTMVAGEALFHVRHNAADPFTVSAGGVAIEDVGTVFSVAQERGNVEVAVAEGSVAVRRSDQDLTLAAGEKATALKGAEVRIGSISPDAVGGWRNHVLIFQGEPLGLVVERLNRLYALNISLDPSLRDRVFTGMVKLTGDGARDIPHVAALTGTTWRRDRGGTMLTNAD